MNEVKQPKVSIILPTYNGSRYLRMAIESCLNQTYQNIELIVVDDASTDNTPEIVGSYHDPRLKYIRHDKNKRLPRALNTGLKAASGEYITWTSDDNQFIPEAVAEMLDFLAQHKEAGLVYADYLAKYLETGSQELRKMPDILDLKKENQVGACFLFTRQAFLGTGYYDPKYELVEDYEYWIRMCQKFKSVHYPKSLYIYGEHGKSLKGTSMDFIILYDRILRYKYGFLPLRKLIKEMSLFLREARTNRPLKESLSIYLRALARISRISLFLSLLCLDLLLYHALRKGIKYALVR
ncbi:MAG: glycosyltransferase [bacterium]|nr:glycosyltransferase [bacterium]